MNNSKDQFAVDPEHLRIPDGLENVYSIRGTLMLAVLAIAVSMIAPIANALQFHRTLILNGEWWRILTCHFTHWNGDHLFWDVAVFAGLGMLCEHRNRVAWRTCMAAAVVLIPVALFLIRPEMQTYRGLSGLDSAFFAMVAVWKLSDSLQDREWPRVVMLSSLCLGFALKLGYEVSTGGTFFVDSSAAGFTPIVEAHVIGAVIGAAMALLSARHHHSRTVPAIMDVGPTSVSSTSAPPSSIPWHSPVVRVSPACNFTVRPLRTL